MKMHSDLGKMYRRNYMVKSQLNSLEAKSRALNEKIGDQTKIDEWAESYITRADAQIDDVHDYMNYRNLGQLAHVRMPGPPTKALPAPKLPIYGQERVPADAVPTLQPESLPPGTTENNLGWTEALPQVGLLNTFGSVLTLGLMGATYGIISYDEYQNKGNLRTMLKPRLRNAAFYAGIGALIAVGYQGVVGTGQWTGGY
jgi:hypothetical protein